MLSELVNKFRVITKLAKQDPGTYVGRAVLMPAAVAEGAGVSADPGMHCTQMYSLKQFPVTPLSNVVTARPVKWGILGEENALVLFIECADLRFRFDELMALSAKPTYPEYLPHITFFYYGVVPDKSVLGIPSQVPEFDILLGPEEVSTLAEDVFEKFNPHHDELGRFAAGDGDISHAEVIARPPSAYPVKQVHPETLNRFSDDDGKTFTPEREQLHKAITASYFTKHLKPVTNPETIVMGGGPAAGKSILMKQGEPLVNYMHVDPDDIKTQLPEFKVGVAMGDQEVGTTVHEESSLLAKKIVERATKENYNLIVDGTGDNEYEKLAKKVAGYRSEGRTVTARYVTVDTETAVKRAFDRGKETGRFVPEPYNREIHRNVSVVFEKALANGLYDKVILVDTNGQTPVQILSATGKRISVKDEKGWQKFLAKAQTNDLVAPTKMPFVMGAPHTIPTGDLRTYLASYGQEWKAQALPKEYEPGKLGQCYENATQLVIHNSDLRYCEGVAYTEKTGSLPFLHAWAVDPDGKVVDPTWPDTQNAKYFGVVYNREAYMAHILKTKYYGVLGGDYEAAKKVVATGARKLRNGKLSPLKAAA